jgi:hypothetical protein
MGELARERKEKLSWENKHSDELAMRGTKLFISHLSSLAEENGYSLL